MDDELVVYLVLERSSLSCGSPRISLVNVNPFSDSGPAQWIRMAWYRFRK
jgi:hypothetical protein